VLGRHAFFPFRNTAAKQPKQWVLVWVFHHLKTGPPLRIAQCKFLHQVMPFEPKLATGNIEAAGRARATDLGGIKTVTPGHCLLVNNAQILGNGADGRRLPQKPNKLGVVHVSFRLSHENGLGEKTFAPQGNETSGIEVLRMQTPDTHGCRLFSFGPHPPRMHERTHAFLG